MHYDGKTWTRVADPASNFTVNLRAITGTSAGVVYMVGDAGTLLYYDGMHWAYWRDGSGATLRSVWYDSLTGGVWAVGDLGLILHSGQATK